MLFYHLIVLDASGSMGCIRQNALSGCNETIQTIRSMQAKSNGDQQHFLSLVTFNSNEVTHVVYDKQPIESVSELKAEQYIPNACTPLYDALGLSVNNLMGTMNKAEKSNVIVTVITDGLENSSTIFTAEKIKRQVDELKQSGWTFAFIGANIDEVTEANKLGIHNTMSFEQDAAGTKKMFGRFRRSVECFCEAPEAARKVASEQDFFVDED